MYSKEILQKFKYGLIVFCFISLSASAQEDLKTSTVKSEPKAVVTYKTTPKINLLIEKINELTEGDEILTERVIKKIRKDSKEHIRRVVADKDYTELTEELKKEAIKESEVNEIIEQLKK